MSCTPSMEQLQKTEKEMPYMSQKPHKTIFGSTIYPLASAFGFETMNSGLEKVGSQMAEHPATNSCIRKHQFTHAHVTHVYMHKFGVLEEMFESLYKQCILITNTGSFYKRGTKVYLDSACLN